MPSARRCPTPTGRGRCTTACLDLHLRPSRRARATWLSSGGSRPRSGSTARSRSRKRLGMPLKIAAKIDEHGSRVLRRARSSRCSPIRWSSSSARSARPKKNGFLGGAAALLFPIDWPEPFGLVMIEAMACGTPVVAFRLRLGARGDARRRVRVTSSTALDEAVARTGVRCQLPRAGVPCLLRGALHRRRMARGLRRRSTRRWPTARRHRRPRTRRGRRGGAGRDRPEATATAAHGGRCAGRARR